MCALVWTFLTDMTQLTLTALAKKSRVHPSSGQSLQRKCVLTCGCRGMNCIHLCFLSKRVEFIPLIIQFFNLSRLSSAEFLFYYIITSHFVSPQVAGVVLLGENAHIQREETLATIHNPSPPLHPPRLFPPTGTAKSVRDRARERGKQEDDVPNSASFLIPLHSSCDGHSPVHRSPRVTAHLILFLCLCMACQVVSEVLQLQMSTSVVIQTCLF